MGTCDNNAAFIGARTARGRRVERDDDTVQLGQACACQPRRLDLGPRPQGTVRVIDQQAFHLLTPQHRPAIGGVEGFNETWGQIGGIGGGRLMGHPDRPARIPGLHQGFQGRDRARRGGQQYPRRTAQPDPHAQRVENTLRVRPGGELITPGKVELRPAQPVRILGREGVGLTARWKDQTPAARLITRPFHRAAQMLQA